MPIATPASIKARYPDLEVVTDSVLDSHLKDASLYVDEGWGDDQEWGETLYTAHMATVGADNGMTRPVGVQSVGSGAHKVSYFDRDAPDWAETRYGRLFLELRARHAGMAVTAV